jgi:tRNA A-37 threonylcarbamoyl transferase component Bud32
MDLSSLLAELPGDLRVVRDRRGLLVVRTDLAEPFLEAGFGPSGRPRAAVSSAVGRRPLGELSVGQQSFLVRSFQHGGLLRWLTGDRFADPARPLRELLLQRELGRRGIDAPEVVAARAVRAFPAGWHLCLATRRVSAAADLGEFLVRRRDGRIAERAWRRLLDATGRFVARLHAAGFEHADLTPRNLLADETSLDSAAPRLWVIDLDGSRFAAALDAHERRTNLVRLARHLERMRREHGAQLSVVDRARFLRGYEPERAQRRIEVQALAGLLGPNRGLHGLGWRLEKVLGRGRSGVERHLELQDRSPERS